MPRDGGHGYAAIAPWWAKIELKTIIFDVFVPSVTLSKNCQHGSHHDASKSTHRLKLSSRKMACDGFGYGWLLGHTQYPGHLCPDCADIAAGMQQSGTEDGCEAG